MICVFLKRFDDQGTIFKVVVHERINHQFVFTLSCRFNDRITGGAFFDALEVACDDEDFGTINRFLSLSLVETRHPCDCGWVTYFRIKSKKSLMSKDPLDGSDFEVVLSWHEWDSVVATMRELLIRRAFDPNSDPEFPT